MRNVGRLAHEMKTAVVVVIHDINFAACYSDKIIALKNGKVVAQGKVEEVIQADILESIYETPFNIIEVDGNANSTPKPAANFTIAICNRCLEDCSTPHSNDLT